MATLNEAQLGSPSVSPHCIAASMSQPGVGVGIRATVRDGQDMILRGAHQSITSVLVDPLTADATHPLITFKQHREKDAFRRQSGEFGAPDMFKSPAFFGMGGMVSAATFQDNLMVRGVVPRGRSVDLVAIVLLPFSYSVAILLCISSALLPF